MTFQPCGYFITDVVNGVTHTRRQVFLPIGKTVGSDTIQYLPRQLFAAIQDSGLGIERMFLGNGTRMSANVSSIVVPRPVAELEEPVIVQPRKDTKPSGSHTVTVQHVYKPAAQITIPVYPDHYDMDDLRSAIADEWNVPWQWVQSAIGALTGVDFLVHGVSLAALRTEVGMVVKLAEPAETLLRTQTVQQILSAHPLPPPTKRALFASPLNQRTPLHIRPE